MPFSRSSRTAKRQELEEAERAQASCIYWGQRLRAAEVAAAPKSSAAGAAGLAPLGKAAAVTKYLRGLPSEGGSLEAPCRLCKLPAKADASLQNISCGDHSLPLCQRTLVPILLEPAGRCALCKRTCLLTTHCGDSLAVAVCGWCASPIMR
eukprot:TRINITY_DN42210_c0_g1_i1.p2 TRINITY_DN42210_c0_g1~~TRINITY_DN42210_c0_g1_i1.p2  ORF type:complete len:151 (-),score=36.42 TRINITY_DN42210_c0_g1_i1:54-506(-)